MHALGGSTLPQNMGSCFFWGLFEKQAPEKGSYGRNSHTTLPLAGNSKERISVTIFPLMTS